MAMMDDLRIVIASPHERHDALERCLRQHLLSGVFRIRGQFELDIEALRKIMPNYIFFPHWSWKVPQEIYEEFECVIFHMTDLPFGRGGSPLQNLVVRGISETQLTALQCVSEMDAGPIYMKLPMSLYGTAEEILMRASGLIEKMIEQILTNRTLPTPQVGEPTIFRRRTPQDGNMACVTTLEQIFDYIRMLDADGYSPAFIETEHFRLEFERASLKPDCVVADVKILRRVS
jgi:methionyl-tRNA formyltransferase